MLLRRYELATGVRPQEGTTDAQPLSILTIEFVAHRRHVRPQQAWRACGRGTDPALLFRPVAHLATVRYAPVWTGAPLLRRVEPVPRICPGRGFAHRTGPVLVLLLERSRGPLRATSPVGAWGSRSN